MAYYPTKGIFNSDWANNTVWIKIQPKKVNNVLVQNIKRLSTTPEGDSYIFLAPNEMQQTLNHTWEPMENILSSISQAITSTSNKLNQGTNVYKVDTPLLYKDSDRREWSFLFVLVFTGKEGSNPYNEVIKPINELKKYSSPQLQSTKTTQSKVQLPYVFSIKSMTGEGKNINNLVNIDTAALTSIQPSYIGPYIDGYPIKVDLTLTFREIDPISRDRTYRNIEVA